MTKREPPRNRKIYERSTQPFGQRPPATPDATVEEVWDRIDTLVIQAAPAAAPEPVAPKQRTRGELRRVQRRRRVIRLLDIVSSIYWLAVLIKLFVADVDRLVVGLLAPEATWILDFRWAIALTLLALILVMFRRGAIALSFAYVAAFPLVVIFWKVPRFFFKRQSPMLVAVAVTIVATATCALGESSVHSRQRCFRRW
jgi:hypothetical protein